MRSGKQLGRFKTLNAARRAWAGVVESSDWSPPDRPRLTPEEMVARDKAQVEAVQQAEHWDQVRKRR